MVGVGRLCPLSLSSQSHFAGQLLGVGVFLSHLSVCHHLYHPSDGVGVLGRGFQLYRLPGTALALPSPGEAYLAPTKSSCWWQGL